MSMGGGEAVVIFSDGKIATHLDLYHIVFALTLLKQLAYIKQNSGNVN